MADIFLYHTILEDICPGSEVSGYLHKIAEANVDLSAGLLKAFPQLTDADVTSAAIFDAERAKFEIVASEFGILSGMETVKAVFRTIDPEIEFSDLFSDGQAVQPRQRMILLEGSLKALLLGERVALNFLCHLSGIATRTNRFVSAIKDTQARILDTRKTIPGLRFYEKQAVLHGGGCNHRAGLWDMVLIKNNHIDAAVTLTKAVALIRQKWGSKYSVIVETRNLAEVREAMNLDVSRIMLDNMPIEIMKQAVSLIEHRVETEASGSVCLSNIRQIAATGVDFISIGGDLTMSAPRLDFSMRFI